MSLISILILRVFVGNCLFWGLFAVFVVWRRRCVLLGCTFGDLAKGFFLGSSVAAILQILFAAAWFVVVGELP